MCLYFFKKQYFIIKNDKIMKKLLILLLCALTSVSFTQAQKSAKDIAKERKAIAKLSQSELRARASKAARKTAKTYVKEGWVVSPGQLPLEKQLDRSYNMQYEYDENAFPKYLMGEAQSIGENYDAAKMQALELAKTNLAGQIQTEIMALVENTVANQQLTADEAASITQTVSASKNIISQSIGRIIPVVECYRILPNKNKEVRVQIAYNTQMAMESAKKTIRQELEKKGDKLHDQLDKVLGF